MQPKLIDSCLFIHVRGPLLPCREVYDICLTPCLLDEPDEKVIAIETGQGLSLRNQVKLR